MNRFFSAFLAALFIAGSAGAQGQLIQPIVAASVASTYTGPGNIVSGATAFYSLRAYTAAIAAAGTQSIVDLRRPADNATCTAKIATSGSVDLTVGTPCNSSTQTVSAWSGAAASCTGAIGPASTTLTVTSCTGTLAVGSSVSGTGVTAGTYITAVVGGCTAASSCTVNTSQTVASTTLTMAQSVPLVSKWYDQSGGTLDATQATAGNQPQLLLTGGSNGRPGLSFLGTAYLANVTFTAIAQPSTFSAVATRTGTFTTASVIGSTNNASGTAPRLVFQNATNTVRLSANTSTFTASASDSAYHAIQGVLNNASSILYIDGASTSGSVGGTAGGDGVLGIGNAFNGTGTSLTGIIEELGIWQSAFSAGNQLAMNDNQHSYYGF